MGLKKYSTGKMNPANPMRNHDMMITNYFSKAKLHGAQIDLVTQVGINLNTISNDFIQFVSIYKMNKLNYGPSL